MNSEHSALCGEFFPASTTETPFHSFQFEFMKLVSVLWPACKRAKASSHTLIHTSSKTHSNWKERNGAFLFYPCCLSGLDPTEATRYAYPKPGSHYSVSGLIDELCSSRLQQRDCVSAWRDINWSPQRPQTRELPPKRSATMTNSAALSRRRLPKCRSPLSVLSVRCRRRLPAPPLLPRRRPR